MAVLAVDRRYKSKWTGRSCSYPVAAATIIYAGALVSLNAAGFAIPASAVAGQRVVGVAQTAINNSAGAAGALEVQTLVGVFSFKNDADAIVAADRGRLCYVQDDQTVQGSAGGSAIVAGIVETIETGVVYVYVAPEMSL
ncbi:MAG: hypothetical protein M3Q39_16855 [Actinomycetota bacterium]|nr:hypothetical protein [Actinomycetota bacterium]